MYISYNKRERGVINVNGRYRSLSLSLYFTFQNESSYSAYAQESIDFNINIGFIVKVLKKYKYGVQFTKSFYDLRADSSSDKILNALKISGNELYKRIVSESCNKFYISDPTNDLYVPLSVKASVSDGIYVFSFSAVADGIWGTPIGGILGIMYTLSSNTYQIIALAEIALKQ